MSAFLVNLPVMTWRTGYLYFNKCPVYLQEILNVFVHLLSQANISAIVQYRINLTIVCKNCLKFVLKPFSTNVPLLCSLKTSENAKFFLMFSGGMEVNQWLNLDSLRSCLVCAKSKLSFGDLRNCLRKKASQNLIALAKIAPYMCLKKKNRYQTF